MPDEIDDAIGRLVQRATTSSEQRKANDAAAAILARAAAREREEFDDKWHADQPVLAGLAQKATQIAAAPFVAFAYRSELAAEAAQLGSGCFVAELTDGSRATVFFDAWASGTITLGYTPVDAAGLVREMPLLSANEETYTAAIVAFLGVLQRARRAE